MQFAGADITEKRWARAMLWSIRYQDRIVHHFRLYVALSAALVSFTGMAGIVPLEAVFRIMIYGGLLLSCAVYYLIVKRRAWLLGIKDPKLKEQAYRAMLIYLAAKGRMPHRARPQAKERVAEEKCTTCRL